LPLFQPYIRINGMNHEKWNYEPFWTETISRIRRTLSEQEYLMWFSNLSYSSSKQNTIELSVPSAFYRDQVKQRYFSLIKNIIDDLTGTDMQISFIITKMHGGSSAGKTAEKTTGKDAEGSHEMKTPASQNHAQQDHAPHSASRTAGSEHSPSEHSPSQFAAAADRQFSSADRAAGNPGRSAVRKKNNTDAFNTDYSFDTFVIGENNSFAYNACLAIAKNPGTSYNPCLIYGGVGLGKTHLIQSIGNYVQQLDNGMHVEYVTAETFTNEFIQAIGERKNQQFKNKYRKVDILLIDDIHFLQNKSQTQEELFHTFNALYDSNKQMVFTCDRPVSELKELTARLRSRFERGLNVDLQPPNFETRMAILRKKCESQGFAMSDAVLEFISRSINTNVRDLEASLTKLIAYSRLLDKEITIDIAMEQLKDSYSVNNEESFAVETIQRVVSDYFNISHIDIRGKKRTKAIAFPRQIAMFIARQMTDLSTTEIGYEFGGRDHSTVMHACQRVESRIQTDPTLDTTIQRLTRQVKEYKRRS